MTPHKADTCISCGDESRYNRRVERVDTGRVMGTLCESCETARFGDTLRAPDSPDNSGCIYCGNTAGYVLPEHTVMLDDEDGDECEISGYFVTDGTPRLCQSHLNAMRLETQTFWPDGTALLEAGD